MSEVTRIWEALLLPNAVAHLPGVPKKAVKGYSTLKINRGLRFL